LRGDRTIGEKVTSEMRHFISSLEGGAAKLIRPIRSHWCIENSLHWGLDVSMGEDACRIWQDHAPANMATLRRVALTLPKQERTNKRGIKARSKKAGLDGNYLLKVLVG
jgi:predicted transposase YbfD/YdcC